MSKPRRKGVKFLMWVIPLQASIFYSPQRLWFSVPLHLVDVIFFQIFTNLVIIFLQLYRFRSNSKYVFCIGTPLQRSVVRRRSIAVVGNVNSVIGMGDSFVQYLLFCSFPSTVIDQGKWTGVCTRGWLQSDQSILGDFTIGVVFAWKNSCCS